MCSEGITVTNHNYHDNEHNSENQYLDSVDCVGTYFYTYQQKHKA